MQLLVHGSDIVQLLFAALLAKAVALTLEKHPIVNAGYDKATNSIVYHKNINVANAVAIDGGLITPVLRDCNLMDILTLSAQVCSPSLACSLRPRAHQSVCSTST